MKRVLVIGAAGMIGRKLTEKLKSEPLTELTLHDVVPSPIPAGAAFSVKTVTSDLSAPGEAEKLVAPRPDLIFHLAAIVSGEAEADFEKGYRINLDGTRQLFEAIRKEGGKVGDGYRPRVVFTSSIAVFGAPFPEAIGDEFLNAPLTSYGTQKAIGELLLSDYSRRGFFDGIGLRLPTICVRPGKPNRAASGFFSGIIREPLAGEEAVLPVPGDGPARGAAQSHDAGDFRHCGRADRSATQGGGRGGGAAHPRAARCHHHAHRRGLAAQFRRSARDYLGLSRRPELRAHHPHSHRRRAR